jgi:hypothetical protein
VRLPIFRVPITLYSSSLVGDGTDGLLPGRGDVHDGAVRAAHKHEPDAISGSDQAQGPPAWTVLVSFGLHRWDKHTHHRNTQAGMCYSYVHADMAPIDSCLMALLSGIRADIHGRLPFWAGTAWRMNEACFFLRTNCD